MRMCETILPRVTQIMDVHRVRFVDLQPQSIQCLAFSSYNDKDQLAVSRADASIELWCQCNGKELRHELTIPGRSDLSVETMGWMQDRLFSSGLTGQIHEWDFTTLTPSVTMDALGSAVWCMDINTPQQTLAVGCDDGKVCLFQITPDSLFFLRSLDRQSCRILSLSWHPDGHLLVAGGNDSTIRVFEPATGRCAQRITLDDYQGRSTLVWSVKLLCDHSLVSADSQGKVQIWDCRFGTLKQSFHCHLADVLALAVCDNNTFYASGVDQKIVKFQRITEGDNKLKKWVRSGEARVHTHDVRSIAVGNGGHIVSGGVDTRIVVYDPVNLNPYHTIQYSPFTVLSSRVHVASSSGVLVVQDNTSLRFWHLSSDEPGDSSSSFLSSELNSPIKNDRPTIAGQNSLIYSPSSSVSSDGHTGRGLPVHFLELKVPGHHHILSSAISSDGAIASLCNIERLWLYKLFSGVVCIGSWPVSAMKMCFSPAGSELALACVKEGLVVMKICLDNEERVKVVNLSSNNAPVSILDIQYSPDGRYLAALTNKHRIMLYSTESYHQLVKLPKLDDILASKFCFNLDSSLIFIYTPTDREIFTYSLKSLQLTFLGCLNYSFGKKAQSSFLSPPLCIFPVTGKYSDMLVLHDTHNLVFVQSTEIEKINLTPANVPNKRKKIHKYLPTHIVPSYKEMLCVTRMHTGALVVVEKPWTDVLSTLPPALARKCYGT